MIKLRFETLDHIHKTKRFKTLAGARKAVHGWVGKDAEIGTGYAISADGVVKVMAEGCTLQELFGDDETKKMLGMHFRIKVDGEYIKETFKYQQDVDRFVEEHSNITYDKPDGSIGVCQVEAELWTDEGGELRKLYEQKDFKVGDIVAYKPNISSGHCAGKVIARDATHLYVKWDDGYESALYREYAPKQLDVRTIATSDDDIPF